MADESTAPAQPAKPDQRAEAGAHYAKAAAEMRAASKADGVDRTASIAELTDLAKRCGVTTTK